MLLRWCNRVSPKGRRGKPAKRKASSTPCSSHVFLKSLSCSHVPGSEPQGDLQAPQAVGCLILPPCVTVRALLAGMLCCCLGFGHCQIIIFPTVFLLLVLILIFFPPGSALQSDERQPGCGWPGQKPLPLAKLKKMHIPLQSHHDRHTGPFCPPLPSHWQKAVSMFGERSAAGLLPLCPPSWRLSFLGPESVPVLACT